MNADSWSVVASLNDMGYGSVKLAEFRHLVRYQHHMGGL